MARRAFGEGSVWRRSKDGRWCAAIPASISPTGKRVVRYFRTEKEARAGLRALHREAAAGAIAHPGNLNLRDLAADFLDAMKTARRSDSTLRLYEQHLRRRVLPVLGRYKLRELRPLHTQRLLSHLLRDGRAHRRAALGPGLAPSTVRGVYLLLSAMAHFAVKQGYLVVPFTQGVVPPRAGEPAAATLDEAGLRALLASAAAAGDPLLPLWYVLVDTGARIGEALGLRWADVALVPPPDAPPGWRPTVRIEHRLVAVVDGAPVFAEPKARSRRTIPLSRATAAALGALRKASLATGRRAEDPSGLVFVTPRGLPYGRATIHYRLQAALVRAGLPRASVHSLRRAGATALLRRRVPTEVVSRRLGHSSEAVTLSAYSRVVQTGGDEAADEIDRMLGPRDAPVTDPPERRADGAPPR